MTLRFALLGVLLAALAVPAVAHEIDDMDLDGSHDPTDNCVEVVNPSQVDTDGDGYGNACDADLNNDLMVDFLDLGMLKSMMFGDDMVADLNDDGAVDFLDLGRMKAMFFEAPGPKCDDCPLEACGGENFASTYEAIQEIVFEGYGCTNDACHGLASQGLLNLDAGSSYANLYNAASASSTKLRVLPGEAKESYLFDRLENGSMPVGGQLTADHLEAIRQWILLGAPETGVVAGTADLLDSCLPPADPAKLVPPVHPGAGVGVQLRQTAWPLPSNSEDEVCMATYYDFTQTNLIPAENRIPCPGDETEECFTFNRRELFQDGQSHHSIIHLYTGASGLLDVPAGQPNRTFAPFTYKPNDPNDPNNGLPCDPFDIDPALGYNPDCSGKVESGVACIGYGPPDYSAGIGGGGDSGGSTAPTIGGSQEAYNVIDYSGSQAFGALPMQGIVVWNSHAFNLTSKDTTMAQYYNLFLSPAEDAVFPILGIFEGQSIFVQNVPPYTTREYCRTWTAPRHARLFELNSHTHRHGNFFRIWDPPNVSCVPGEPACVAGPEERLIYTSREYSDPLSLRYSPARSIDAEADIDRTFLFCSRYDNGIETPVKLQSQSPAPPLIFGLPLGPGGPCGNATVACVEGPNQGQLCGGDHTVCDPDWEVGDPLLCDACPVLGGVTTEDEMFILLGNFYIDDTAAAAAE